MNKRIIATLSAAALIGLPIASNATLTFQAVAEI
jgi:hypothetical protein